MNRIRVMGIAAAFPLVLAAQQPAATPTQPPANPITQGFKSFNYYGNWLSAAFDSIPAGKYSYKPTPIQQTVGYIAQHLEGANYQLCALFGGVKPAMTAKDSLADTVKALWPKDTLVARLKASLVFCQGALDRLDDSKMADLIPVGAANSGRTSVRSRLITVFLTDLAEHYAQVASYMRLNGMVPPSALPRPRPGG
jgi:hypothetical protein